MKGFNTFTVVETSGGIARTFTVTATPGNSSRGAFATDIISKLNLASTSSGYGWTYSITFPDQFTQVDTGQYTTQCVQGSSGSAIQSIVFTFAALTTSLLCEPYGFSASTSYSFAPVAGINTLVSPNVSKLQGEDSIVIRSNICNSYSSVATGSGTLQVIFASGGNPAFSNIVFQQFDVEGNARTLTNVGGAAQFTITNEDGDSIFFNGLNVQFELMAFRLNDTSRANRGFIKLMTYVIDKWFPKIEEIFDIIMRAFGGPMLERDPAPTPAILEQQETV